MDADRLSEESLLPALRRVYDLAEPVTCTLSSSGLNDVYEVRTRGSARFLKVYRAGWRTQEEVLEELAVLLHLQRKRAPAVLPIARRDGEFAWTLASERGEHQVVLYSAAPGTTVYPPEESHLRLFGRALAEIHNATDDFSAAPVRFDPDSLLVRPLRALGPLLGPHPEEREFLRELAARLQERIERMPAGALDWGYCHGDYRPANLCVDAESAAVTAYDFEMGGMGFRAYDLAHMQTNLHPLALELLWGAPPLECHEQRWAGFLSGYAETRPLRPADLDAIPHFVAMRPVRILGTLLQTAHGNRDLEPWTPSVTGSLPGGDLLSRVVRFLRAWDSTCL